MVSLVLLSSIVLGQAIKPNRIVFNGDTGIFFNKQQEILLLTIIKNERANKLELEQMYIYKNNCAKTQEKLKIQKDRKRKWRNAAIGSGIVNLAFIYLIAR